MSNVIMCSECKKCDGDRCNYFDNDSDRESTIACIIFEPKNPTVFETITSSPEVLAKELVTTSYDEFKDCTIYWAWLGNGRREAYYSESEALAATVAKLKEQSK